MSIDDWIPTTKPSIDSVNLSEVVELKVSIPVVHAYVPPLFVREISRSTGGDVLPIDDSRIRPEGQDDTEYWLDYRN